MNTSLSENNNNNKHEQQLVDQLQEIEIRLNRLMGVFNQLSPHFNDVLGISRALRGNCPRLGTEMNGYVAMLPKSPKIMRRQHY